MRVVMQESVDRLPTLGAAMHLYVVPTEAEREPNVSLIGDRLTSSGRLVGTPTTPTPRRRHQASGT